MLWVSYDTFDPVDTPPIFYGESTMLLTGVASECPGATDLLPHCSNTVLQA